MSYILDALKKADADREREAAVVPDLYAQADAVRGARAAARAPGWVLPALGAGAVAIGALVWHWYDSPTGDAPPPAVAAQAPAVTPAGMAAPPPAPTPAPVATTAPANPVAPPQPAAAPTPAPASMAMPRPAAAPVSAARVAVPAAAATTTQPVAAAASATATEARLPTLAELPPDIRNQLPALSVGGSMYSPQPASRMVILNGQVFREGDTPVDGLTIERIRLKSTVLAFRGVHFELKH